MAINEDHCKSFGNGRKVMKLWIITLQMGYIKPAMGWDSNPRNG